MIISPKASQSFNSPAVIRHQIRSAELVHWFWGLRQAELCINDRSEAIIYSKEEFALASERLNNLEAIVKPTLTEQIEATRIRRNTVKVRSQFTDAEEELFAAKEEYDRICVEHSNELQANSAELEELYSKEVWEARQTRVLAEKILAISYGPEAAAAIMDIAPDRRSICVSNAEKCFQGIMTQITPKTIEASINA